MNKNEIWTVEDSGGEDREVAQVWRVDEVDGDAKKVASVFALKGESEDDLSRAHLIAAAPELLEQVESYAFLLKSCMTLENGQKHPNEDFREACYRQLCAAKAAIRRAQGETP